MSRPDVCSADDVPQLAHLRLLELLFARDGVRVVVVQAFVVEQPESARLDAIEHVAEFGLARGERRRRRHARRRAASLRGA